MSRKMTIAIKIGPSWKIIVHIASFLNEKARNFIAWTSGVFAEEIVIQSAPLFNLTHHPLKYFVNGLTGRID